MFLSRLSPISRRLSSSQLFPLVTRSMVRWHTVPYVAVPTSHK
jgi:acetyl-CoA C-acetyltransferase